ncbi:MAG: 50S ribosomal protein L19 [Candidatus Moranbacteria bacterium]|nr:50S ribosomal protein L19 [Candidatus Moranbacteria bacterium]
MDQRLIDFNKSQQRADIPEIQTGDIVRVHKKIKEGEKERIQIFKGLVIAIKGKQSSSPTITVRRDSQGIGTEMVLPIYLPSIKKIEVLRHSKVRRSKLYYMRDRSGKSAKMKIKDFSEQEKTAVKEKEKSIKTKKGATKKPKEEVKSEIKEKVPKTENKKLENTDKKEDGK